MRNFCLTVMFYIVLAYFPYELFKQQPSLLKTLINMLKMMLFTIFLHRIPQTAHTLSTL